MLWALAAWKTSDSQCVVTLTLALAWLTGHLYVTWCCTKQRRTQ